MAERATVYQVVQLGKEVTPGTAVAATRKMAGYRVTPSIRPDVKTYRPSGHAFPTAAVLNKEWVEADISGPLLYDEMAYWLSGLIKSVSPTGAGTAKTWVWSPSSTSEDTRQTYTVEVGGSVRAGRFAYGILSGLNISIDRNEATMGGSLLARSYTDGHTMTAALADNTIIPVALPHVLVYLADTEAGLAGATALGRALRVQWAYEDALAAAWFLNGKTYHDVTVDQVPNLTAKLRVAADSEGMALLTTMRNGATKFMRIKAVGALITGSDYYTLQVDTALKVTEPTPFEDADGIYALEWTMQGVHDATSGWATEITLINTLAAL